MIVNTEIFKKLMREAYTGSGLHVKHKDGMLHIWGNCWCVRVKDEFFTKKEKAALIELIGDIPEEGTIRAHSKEELMPQPNNNFEDFMQMDPKTKYWKTNIMITEGEFGEECRLLVSDKEAIVPVLRRYVDLVDEEAVTKDDSTIIGPYQVEGSSWLMCWRNNTTAVAVAIRNWEDETTLTALKDGVEQLVDLQGVEIVL